MFHINMLPWREEQRELTEKQFKTQVKLVAAITIVVLAGLHFWFAHLYQQQSYRNEYLKQIDASYDKKLIEISKLKKTRVDIGDRMKIIRQLQLDRNYIVHLFSTFVGIAPDGLYFIKIVYKFNRFEIYGRSSSNTQVSRLMLNIEKSKWLKSPKLILIKSTRNIAIQREFQIQAQPKLPNTNKNEKDGSKKKKADTKS